MNPAAPLFDLVRAVRRTLRDVFRAMPGPHLEAGARRNAWNAMTETTTRRRNYAKARAGLGAEEDRLRARHNGPAARPAASPTVRTRQAH